jgi:DNA-binding LacI/PurR family transcriptional regulator
MGTSTRISGQPKYWRWAQELKRQIKNGELAPGDRLPSQAEMRDRYGVSRPLVERAHAILAEEGLIVREAGRGVFVAQPTRKKAAKTRAAVIGCLSCGVSLRHQREHRAYWSHLLDGIEAEAHAAGSQLLLFDHFSPGDAWEKIDGVLTTGDAMPASLPGIPSVSLLHPARESSSIVMDSAGGAQQAVQHLVELGHERIGCLMFTDNPLSLRKIAGYEAGLRAAGIVSRPAWQRSLTEPGEANFDFMAYGERRVADWLNGDWRALGITALLCENDQTAIGAIAALFKAGLSVPCDVSVVGFDGTEISKYSHPALTTVEAPLEAIGRRGVQEVLLQIEERHSGVREIVLPTHLQVRASTASRFAKPSNCI